MAELSIDAERHARRTGVQAAMMIADDLIERGGARGPYLLWVRRQRFRYAWAEAAVEYAIKLEVDMPEWLASMRRHYEEELERRMPYINRAFVERKKQRWLE